MIEIKREYWSNGKLKYEIPCEDGLIQGVSRSWYETGQIEYEDPYKNGELHGVYKSWFENGQIRIEISYQNNVRHGITKEWDEEGRLVSEEYFLYNRDVSEEEYRKHKLAVHKFKRMKCIWGLPHIGINKGDVVLMLGEVEDMPGHCVVVKKDGTIAWGFHTERFEEVNEDDI